MNLQPLIARGLWSALVLLAVSVATFVLLRLVPADPARLIAGPKADATTVAAVRRDLGLDEPTATQLLRHLSALARGDLGRSYRSGRPVRDEILDRLPASALLASAAITVGLVVGLALALLTSPRSGRWVDVIVLSGCLLVLATPVFWLGLLLLDLFAARLAWLPLGGGGGLKPLVLPALTLGLPTAALYARLLHTSLERELASAHLRTARAKGLSPHRVLLGHALPCAMGPLVVAVGLDLGGLLGGAVLTETVFAWPGIGRLAVNAVFDLDLPVVMATTWVAAVLVVLANLAADLVAAWLDPRISARASEGGR